MHTAAHETGRVLVAAKDGAFCMEVRVMIKQVDPEMSAFQVRQ